MAKQTATVTVSQADWDTKFGTTTEALKDLGGTDAVDADDLPESTTKKWAGETGATADQTGGEIQTAVEGLTEAARTIMISDPQTGEYKVHGAHRNAAGDLEYDYDDVAV